MSYLILKHIHVTAVLLSGTGFFLRGLLMLNDSPLLGKRLLKVLPHVVDTVLLGSALAMAVISAQYPFVLPWLTAKFFGLLAYIVFGMMALKRGRTKAQRAAWFVAALAAFGYIVSVALTRDPRGLLAVVAG
ncbi:MAG: SirB2 family protein [Rhodocyclales bacterium]|nr:SirB2 family protein [Rhodocyclales bacterium]